MTLNKNKQNHNLLLYKMAAVQDKYSQILSSVTKGIFKPIYLLMGDEPYYIDVITDAIVANALDDSERDFNQTILYGIDVEVSSLINAAKRYPMMAQRQLIVVKEAQMLDGIEELIYYAEEVQPTTVFVICYKGGLLKNKKLISAIEKVGEVYESKKLYDNQLPVFITNYASEHSFEIEPKAVSMLADFIGNDLNRITGELNKLFIVSQGKKEISALLVEEHIGISKDYNNFELQAAIINKDSYKANRIINYFESNPKNNSIIPTISILFNLFSNLLLAYYAKDKSDMGLIKDLNLRNQYQLKDYKKAMTNYNVFKCVDIIAMLREYDAKSKGVGVPTSITDAALLRELVYKIMH